jgi:hypothetical protein
VLECLAEKHNGVPGGLPCRFWNGWVIEQERECDEVDIAAVASADEKLSGLIGCQT